MLKNLIRPTGIVIVLLWTMGFRYYLAHLVNSSLRTAGETTLVQVLLVAENIIILSYYVGIILMLVGIGRDVTLKGILTFNMRDFEPQQNFAYKAGFIVNRVSSLFSLYFLIGMWAVGRPLTPFISFLCVLDVCGSVLITAKLTSWLKHYGTRPQKAR